MFVLSSGLSASGVVHAMGRLIARVRQPLPMTMLVLLLVGVLSAFINNTAAVAVFLPVVLATTAANRIPASQLLIPMSYAAHMAGVCTLVGTRSEGRRVGKECVSTGRTRWSWSPKNTK